MQTALTPAADLLRVVAWTCGLCDRLNNFNNSALRSAAMFVTIVRPEKTSVLPAAVWRKSEGGKFY